MNPSYCGEFSIPSNKKNIITNNNNNNNHLVQQRPQPIPTQQPGIPGIYPFFHDRGTRIWHSYASKKTHTRYTEFLTFKPRFVGIAWYLLYYPWFINVYHNLILVLCFNMFWHEPHLSRQSLRFRRCHSAKGKPVPKTTMLARTKPNLKLGLAGISRDVIRSYMSEHVNANTNANCSFWRVCTPSMERLTEWQQNWDAPNICQPGAFESRATSNNRSVLQCEMSNSSMLEWSNLLLEAHLISCQVAFLWANHSSVLHNLKQSTKK